MSHTYVRPLITRFFVWTAVLLCCVHASLAREPDTHWRAFRNGGPSVADGVDLPVRWSIESGENVAWTADLPGRGVSSPIVVGGRVFVTAASGPHEDRLHVLAFDLKTGRLDWERVFWATGRTLFHPASSVAANTPASDGERIFAFFSSNDLFALDLDGNVQWIRGLTSNYPLAGNDVGMASSPAVVDGTVVVQSEAQAESFAAGIDAATGATRWDVERTRSASWCSPVGVKFGAGGAATEAVLLQSPSGVAIHAAVSGEKLWEASIPCEGTPSAVFDELLYLPSNGLMAFDLESDADGPKDVWRETRLRGGSSSPVIYDDWAYVLNNSGVLSARSLEGNQSWKLRLGGRHWATPIASQGRLYCINADGQAFVVRLGEKGELLSEIDFGESVYASPAAADDALLVRSHSKLWKIAKSK